MRSGIQLSALPFFIAMLAGCSADDGSAPPPPSVVGVWNQGANLRDAVNQQTHIHTGAFSFVQSRLRLGR
jgi:hypothetical protein